MHRRFIARVSNAVLAIGVTGVALLSGTRMTPTVAAQGSVPTFNADVAPILYEKCATCHRPGAGGPMSLTSYSEVRPWARSMMARVT